MKLLIALALAAAPSALAMAPYVPDDEGPTAAPTLDPTAAPTKDPTPAPTKEPTPAPTKAPVAPIPGPSWTRVMNAGSISQFSEVCTSYNTWRASLTGAETTITVSTNGATVTCTDSAQAAAITTAIRDLSADGTGPPFPNPDLSISCGGLTWSFGSCGVTYAVPALEIHAAGTTTCDCPNYAGTTGIIMRPCIGNENWGGGNGPTCNAPTQTFFISTTL